MEYNINNVPAEEGIDLKTISQYAVRILKKWYFVLISALIFAGLGFGVAHLRYQPMYSCKMQFVVDNKNESTVSGGISSADISAAKALAEDYKYIMTSSESLMKLVAAGSGYDVTPAEVSKMISAELVENTAVIAVTVTSSDKDVSYAVAQSYLNSYSQVTDKAHANTRAITIDGPAMPEKPNPDNSRLMYTALGFILGAGLVVAAISVKIAVEDTVKDSSDVEKKLGTKVLGSVIHLKKNDKKNDKKSLLITDRRVGFMFIETFKQIRAKIENISRRHDYKTFMVTSESENEGKTTVAVNLALALAQNGKSVLLVDADLRKPAVFKTLGVSAANETGLAGVIRGEKSLSDSIKYFEKFNLFLLITGQASPDAAELFSSEIMTETLDSLSAEFDYVIMDTPPAGIVSDTSVIAQQADACVMVIRRDHAPMRKIRRTMEDIVGAGAEVVGCVYNDADVSAVTDFLKKSRKKANYSYGYSYGYDYSDTSKK